MQFVKSDEERWCEHCDQQKGSNLISLWGKVTSGELGNKFQRVMYGEYVQVTFYLCDDCIKECATVTLERDSPLA